MVPPQKVEEAFYDAKAVFPSIDQMDIRFQIGITPHALHQA
jgi:hypothetical protein